MSLNDLLLLSLLALWGIGTGLRAYRHAHFYQLEEYSGSRYLYWLVGERGRWLPERALGAWVIGVILPFVTSEAPGSAFPTVIALVVTLVGIVPPRRIEIKKPFRPTLRARRLLAATWVVIGLVTLVAAAVILSRQSGVAALQIAIAHTTGFALFLLAPLALLAGNALMTPIEAAIRRRYLHLARHILDEIHPVVIGITGSYGKTTTKTYLAHILNGRYHAYPTPKSYNTLMGISTAINRDLADNRRIDYFIAEMGAYIPGEIERICQFAPPAISMVVEVGPQHLERFGSLENVAIAKYEIIKALPPDGVGVFNWDNPYIRTMMERGYPATRIGVSHSFDTTAASTEASTEAGSQPRFIAEELQESLEGLTFIVYDRTTGERVPFTAPILGSHNVTNLLCATAVAVHEGMSLREVARRVATLQPAESRLVSQTTTSGVIILNDAYSANPVGVVSALHTLKLHTTGRRLLITPGMVELGALMETENRRLGELAAGCATDIILIGEKQTEPIRAGLLAAGFDPAHLQVMERLDEATTWMQRNSEAGDTVLFLNDLPDTYSRA